MSIVDHPQWAYIRPHVKIEIYGRDGGPHNPRHRIEITPPDATTAYHLMQITMPCVACGRTMHPIRERSVTGGGRGHLYYAAACPLDENVGCSRGQDAHDEYLRVKQAIESGDPPAGAAQWPLQF